MSDERDRILLKIEKCMRLSKSSEPHEAAAALRQAQKLMELHAVSAEEMGAVNFGDGCINTPIPARSKLPLFMSELINLISRTFGVEVVIERYYPEKGNRQLYRMRYWGPTARVKLAIYAHAVVFRAANAAWASAVKAEPELATRRNARLNFRIAWLNAVRDTVEALGVSEEERASTKLVKEKHYGGALSKSKTNTSAKADYDAASKGMKAASGFSLHRPMGGADQLRIGKG